MPVAPRIVNDVSGAVFAEVGGCLLLLRAL